MGLSFGIMVSLCVCGQRQVKHSLFSNVINFSSYAIILAGPPCISTTLFFLLHPHSHLQRAQVSFKVSPDVNFVIELMDPKSILSGFDGLCGEEASKSLPQLAHGLGVGVLSGLVYGMNH